jgi:hypothetical protein
MFKQVMLGAVVLSIAACGGSEGAADGTASVEDRLSAINMDPADFAQAEQAFEELNALLTETHDDARVVAAGKALSEKVDVLNGLLATVVVGERTVSFFQSPDGSRTVSDSGPMGSKSVLETAAYRGLAPAELFRAVAPNRELPPALRRAAPLAAATADSSAQAEQPARQAAANVAHSGGVQQLDQVAGQGIAAKQSALTGSDADAIWFVNNRCPASGEAYCYPQWGGGAWASYGNFKNSHFNIAPYAGNFVIVKQTTDGSVRGNFTVVPGEDRQFASWGPTISVSDSCSSWWPWSACGYHPDTKKVWHQWEVLNAAGDSFHWGGNWYN